MRTTLLHLALLAVGLALPPVPCLAQTSLTLAAGGRTDYVIVVGRDAIAPELSVARELSAYPSTVTGAEFLVMGEGDRAARSTRRTPSSRISRAAAGGPPRRSTCPYSEFHTPRT